LTRSGLTYLEVSSEVCHDSFCQLGNSVSLSLVVCHEALFTIIIIIIIINHISIRHSTWSIQNGEGCNSRFVTTSQFPSLKASKLNLIITGLSVRMPTSYRLRFSWLRSFVLGCFWVMTPRALRCGHYVGNEDTCPRLSCSQRRFWTFKYACPPTRIQGVITYIA